MRKLLSLVVPLAALALAAAACGGGGSGGGGGTSVNATEKDFSIELDATSVPAGAVSFSVNNEGPSTHEFEILETDTPPDELPVASGEVETDEIGVVDEAEDIAPGTSTTLDVDLQPGSYVIICNIPGHYEQGMHVDLTVE